RMDAPHGDFADQGSQAGLDVVETALPAPVILGREADQVARAGERSAIEHVDLTEPQAAVPASRGVVLEVVRERLLELERDAPAHHADAVDRVHQRLGVGLQDVTCVKLDHRETQKYRLRRTATSGVPPAAGPSRIRRGHTRSSVAWHDTPMLSTRCQGK